MKTNSLYDNFSILTDKNFVIQNTSRLIIQILQQNIFEFFVYIQNKICILSTTKFFVIKSWADSLFTDLKHKLSFYYKEMMFQIQLLCGP